jgi:hypothetical protein
METNTPTHPTAVETYRRHRRHTLLIALGITVAGIAAILLIPFEGGSWAPAAIAAAACGVIVGLSGLAGMTVTLSFGRSQANALDGCLDRVAQLQQAVIDEQAAHAQGRGWSRKP